jgi:peroxiredoxin
LQLELGTIKSLGAQLIAISPQLPDQSLTLQKKENLEFHVLSDVGNNVARDFGLVFSLPEALRPVYANFGIDLPTANGDSSFELPVPATYVIDQSSNIILDFVEINHTLRLEPSKIIKALKELS